MAGGLFELCQVLPRVPNQIGTLSCFCYVADCVGPPLPRLDQRSEGLVDICLWSKIVSCLRDPIKNQDDHFLLFQRDSWLSIQSSGTPDSLSICGRGIVRLGQVWWHHLQLQVCHPVQVTPYQHLNISCSAQQFARLSLLWTTVDYQHHRSCLQLPSRLCQLQSHSPLQWLFPFQFRT